jgi:hypothetical protein
MKMDAKEFKTTTEVINFFELFNIKLRIERDLFNSYRVIFPDHKYFIAMDLIEIPEIVRFYMTHNCKFEMCINLMFNN